MLSTQAKFATAILLDMYLESGLEVPQAAAELLQTWAVNIALEGLDVGLKKCECRGRPT